MKKKPKGRKYRNLFARGSVIYYERVVKGRRATFSCKTDSWDEAASVRDLWEQRKGVGILGALPVQRVPTFADFADRYLKEATDHLAPTTLEDRTGHVGELGPEDEKRPGPVRAHFGAMRIDDIGRREVIEWHQTLGGSPSARRNRLNALAAVLAYAVDLELLESNPVDAVRAVLRRRNRTKAGRSQAEAGQHIKPIAKLSELRAFTEASVARGGTGHVLAAIMLDAGLRAGEALGLTWADVHFGRDGSDLTRALTIRRTLARGRHAGGTKSGRTRVVQLSRRLRGVLLEAFVAAGRPEPERRVLDGVDYANWRRRHFDRVCKAAEIGKRSPKDLRDTFASQLLTAGVALPYVSQQLGHSDVAVTARHYARWCSEEYRAPVALAPGEVPADLIARIVAEAQRKAAAC